jgi:hypothetical protein
MRALAKRSDPTPARVAIGSSSVSRRDLEARTEANPALVKELLAAEPRSTPAVVRRRTDDTPTEPSPARVRATTRRPPAQIKPVTKPPPLSRPATEVPWPEAPSHLPLFILAIAIATLAAIIVLR